MDILISPDELNQLKAVGGTAGIAYTDAQCIAISEPLLAVDYSDETNEIWVDLSNNLGMVIDRYSANLGKDETLRFTVDESY